MYIDKFDSMVHSYIKDEITTQQMDEFCTNVIKEGIEKNKQILKRLKKTLDKQPKVCYNKDTEREVLKMPKEYEVMREAYIKGEITNMQWFMYCEKCLEKLMKENKKVLDNLK